MYKSRFKYLGQTGFILTIGFLILVLDAGLLIKYLKSGQDVRTLMYLGPLLLFGTMFVWSKILTEMNHVTITDSKIEIKNLFTQRTRTIKKQEIKGFKDILSNGYTILIVDNSDKVIGKLHDYYYSDFNGLRDNLGLDYVGRVKTFWDKIIKIEVEK